MRTTSRVLGIIGAAISILLSMLLLFGAVSFLNTSIWENRYDESDAFDDVMPKSQYVKETSLAGGVFLVFGIAAVAAGVLGLVGGIIVKKKNVAAGVMMIIAAVVSLFTFFNVASMTLFIIGAVMAFKREPQMVMVPYPAYPPQYYPYPPQPYPPQAAPYPPPYPPYPQPPVQNPPQPQQQQ